MPALNVVYGKLQYYNDYCVAYVDNNLARYYRALLPKAWYVQAQAYPAHVTVVRKHKEVAPNYHRCWGKYGGVYVPVYYWLPIRSNGVYYWLDAISPSLNAVRYELGLSQYRQNFNSFHITIGNNKLVN